MQAWIISLFKNIPTEAVILIFVIVPSIISILAITYRFLLYARLRELSTWAWTTKSSHNTSQAPEAIKTIRKNYQETIEKLDNVNTLALIDHIYAYEKVGGVSCEQVEYLTKVLPNLLISMGLFGTFIGLTINLASIGEINSDLNIADIQSKFSGPLSGMSVAFISSLVALAWGITLTLINSLFNTGLAKQRFMVAIEFYLDNDLSAAGKDQTSRIVAGMAKELNNFLERFGQTVKQAVQDSLGAEVRNMVAANKEATDLADRVYKKFEDAAGNITGGAQTFSNAVSSLNSSGFSDKFTQATNKLVSSQEKLEAFMYGLEMVIKSSNQANQNAIKVCDSIQALETQITQVLQVVHTNQTDFSSIAQDLRQGSQDFLAVQGILSSAVEQIEQVKSSVNSRSEELSQIQTELSNLVTLFNQANDSAITNQNNLNSAILEMKEANSAVAENLNLGANKFTEITETVESLTKRVEQLGNGLNNRAELQNRSQQELVDSFKSASSTMNSLLTKINTLNTEFSNRSVQLSNIQNEFTNISRLFREVQNDARKNNVTLNSQLETFSTKLNSLASAIYSIEKSNSVVSQQYEKLNDTLNTIIKSMQNFNAKPITETLNTIKTVLDTKL